MKNYYDILEVSRKASKDTINKVFKMHMKANHPDLFQGEEKIKAEEKSKEFTEAYNILSDDAQRAKYDEELDAEESYQTASQVESILQENEYLKQVIAQKDEYITRITGGAFENPQYNNVQNPYYNQYQQPNFQQQYQQNAGGYGGFNGFTPPQPKNPYEGMTVEELKELKKEQTKQYYKNMFKEIGIKVIIFILLMVVLLISLFSSFKDLATLFGK